MLSTRPAIISETMLQKKRGFHDKNIKNLIRAGPHGVTSPAMLNQILFSDIMRRRRHVQKTRPTLVTNTSIDYDFTAQSCSKNSLTSLPKCTSLATSTRGKVMPLVPPKPFAQTTVYAQKM